MNNDLNTAWKEFLALCKKNGVLSSSHLFSAFHHATKPLADLAANADSVMQTNAALSKKLLELQSTPAPVMSEAIEVEPLLTDREKAIHMAAYEKGARDTIAAMRPAVVDEDELKLVIEKTIKHERNLLGDACTCQWPNKLGARIFYAIRPYLRDAKQESVNE